MSDSREAFEKYINSRFVILENGDFIDMYGGEAPDYLTNEADATSGVQQITPNVKWTPMNIKGLK